MKTLSEKIKITQKQIAEKFNTSEGYVHQILTGKRKPKRGKGLEIKKYAESLVKNLK